MNKYIKELLERYPSLEATADDAQVALNLLIEMYRNGGTLYVAGNGGSAADAEHIVGELMKTFRLKRPLADDVQKRIREINVEEGDKLAELLQRGLPAISLNSHVAFATAVINDVDGYYVMAQQLMALGKPGDTLLAISTSGNSRNVIYAATVAKAIGMKVIGLTGEEGGKLCQYSDIMVKVPERETYKVQELHLPVYHGWCMALEEEMFG